MWVVLLPNQELPQKQYFFDAHISVQGVLQTPSLFDQAFINAHHALHHQKSVGLSRNEWFDISFSMKASTDELDPILKTC